MEEMKKSFDNESNDLEPIDNQPIYFGYWKEIPEFFKTHRNYISLDEEKQCQSK